MVCYVFSFFFQGMCQYLLNKTCTLKFDFFIKHVVHVDAKYMWMQKCITRQTQLQGQL